MQILNFFALGFFFLTLIGCTNTPDQNYADPNQVEIVGDKWNETDARLTAQKMVSEMLSSPWVQNWRDENNESHKARPFILVDDFENRTSEQIDTKALFEYVRSELINSGKVRFLDGAVRQKLLEEYKYQQSSIVRQQGAKKPGDQYGADFFLIGALSSLVSQQGGYKTVTYQVEMRLTNIGTSEISWSAIERIKKQFRRSGAGL